MEKFKKYGGWGLGVLALLLLSAVVVRAATGGYLINVESWSGNVNVADPSGSLVNFGAAGGVGSHTKALTTETTLDVGTDLTVTGSSVLASSTRIVSLVKTGVVVTKTTTSTLTAAEVCDAGVIISANADHPALALTLPTSSTLFADCLTTNGDSIRVSVYNQSSVSSTLLVAGAGGPAAASSSAFLIIQAADTAVLELIRTSTIGYVLKRL